ncbi:MAG TPA: PTS glucose transporter subunit IIA [Lactovum miscens]|uniref:PTS sugar transporter subunit IIA n=1 Tax=Lactovum miscens TaxID=190387 RepID=UPI002ED9BF81
MLGFGKKKNALKDDKGLYAPLGGQVIKIEETSDPIFSQKIMGEGFAIEPREGKVTAPISGMVTLAGAQALGFTREDGLEVLLHLGIDTVSLDGAPFTFNVKVGDVVKGGEEIGSVNWSIVEAAGLEKTSMVIFTNTADKLADFAVDYGSHEAGASIGSANIK